MNLIPFIALCCVAATSIADKDTPLHRVKRTPAAAPVNISQIAKNFVQVIPSRDAGTEGGRAVEDAHHDGPMAERPNFPEHGKTSLLSTIIAMKNKKEALKELHNKQACEFRRKVDEEEMNEEKQNREAILKAGRGSGDYNDKLAFLPGSPNPFVAHTEPAYPEKSGMAYVFQVPELDKQNSKAAHDDAARNYNDFSVFQGLDDHGYSAEQKPGFNYQDSNQQDSKDGAVVVVVAGKNSQEKHGNNNYNNRKNHDNRNMNSALGENNMRGNKGEGNNGNEQQRKMMVLNRNRNNKPNNNAAGSNDVNEDNDMDQQCDISDKMNNKNKKGNRNLAFMDSFAYVGPNVDPNYNNDNRNDNDIAKNQNTMYNQAFSKQIEQPPFADQLSSPFDQPAPNSLFQLGSQPQMTPNPAAPVPVQGLHIQVSGSNSPQTAVASTKLPPLESILKFANMLLYKVGLSDNTPNNAQGTQALVNPTSSFAATGNPLDLDDMDSADYAYNAFDGGLPAQFHPSFASGTTPSALSLSLALPLMPPLVFQSHFSPNEHDRDHDFQPMNYFENTFDSLLMNGDTGGDGDDNDDEYELRCPVHHEGNKQNSAGGNPNDVVQVCSCRIYKKKKNV